MAKQDELFTDSDNDDEYVFPTFFKTQQEAINSAKAKNHNIIIKSTNFKFGSCENNEALIELINESSEAQRTYYEVLQENKPQKMFCEMDAKNIYGEKKLNASDVAVEFIKLMTAVSNKLEINLDPKKWKLTTSSNDYKISIHAVYPLIFKNSEEQRKFWDFVLSVAMESFQHLMSPVEKIINDTKTYKFNFIVDMSVYTKNRAMRTIYSHKQKDAARVLKPFKISKKKIKILKNISIADYLIYVPNLKKGEEFFIIDYPHFPAKSNQTFKHSDIENIILGKIPNVSIREFRSPLFILKNEGKRKCLIGGEINESDNCYVLLRQDGLWFGCHDDDCKTKKKKISSFNLPNVDTKTIDDLRTDASKITTFKNRVNFINQVVMPWLNKRYCLAKTNKTFIIAEYQDIDEDDRECVGVTYKDIKSFGVDLMNKNLNTQLTTEEIETHKYNLPTNPNKIDIANLWLGHKNRREVDKIIFDPKIYFDMKSGKSTKHSNYYNLFTGFEISEESVTDIVVPDNFEEHAFFEHLRKRWCSNNLKSYNTILNVFAHILQKPWEKLQLAVILKSTERTGKGVPLQVFKNIMGSKYFFQPSSVKQVLGDFNGQMKNCLICFMDEMVWGGDKEKAGTLKKLVTENTNYVNEKYSPVIKVKNLSNIFMASNEDWVVPAGATEQRWLVENVDDELAICDKEKKRKIIKEILSIDLKILAKFLYSRNLSGWSHRETVNTSGLREQKIQSLPSTRKWWYEKLCSESLPFNEWIDKQTTYEAAGINDRHLTSNRFWRDIQKVIGIKEYKSKRKMVNGERRWYIKLPELEKCRTRWGVLYNDDGWDWERNEGADDSDDDVSNFVPNNINDSDSEDGI